MAVAPPPKEKSDCPVKKGGGCPYEDKAKCPHKTQGQKEIRIPLKEKRVYLIGTVHVSKESAMRVEDTIRTVLPNIVCVELDLQRFKAMQEVLKPVASGQADGQNTTNSKSKTEDWKPKTPLGEGGHFPYSPSGQHLPGQSLLGGQNSEHAPQGQLHSNLQPGQQPSNLQQGQLPSSPQLGQLPSLQQGRRHPNPQRPEPKYTAQTLSFKEILTFPGLLKWLQQQIGEEFGVMPGSEMASAVETARKYNLDIGLVDRPIDVTIARMWVGMKFKEKIRLFGALGAASGMLLLKPLFGKKTQGLMSMFGSNNELDITKLEKGEGVEELMVELERQFPSIHRALVDERNAYMCNNVLHILRRGADNVVVVVGLGHVPGMKVLLEAQGVKVIV